MTTAVTVTPLIVISLFVVVIVIFIALTYFMQFSLQEFIVIVCVRMHVGTGLQTASQALHKPFSNNIEGSI